MRNIFLPMLAVLLTLLLPLRAEAYETLDAFIEAAKSGAAAGGDYAAFTEALDPGDRQPQMTDVGTALANAFGGDPLNFDVLFRVQDTDVGARLVGVLWRGYDYLYIAILMHKRPDQGWMPITTSFQGQYDKILPYM